MKSIKHYPERYLKLKLMAPLHFIENQRSLMQSVAHIFNIRLGLFRHRTNGCLEQRINIKFGNERNNRFDPLWF